MSADWTEALDRLVARTKHERYRALCADDHPDREAWRARVVELADAMPGPAAYPSAPRQAATLGRSLWDWATSGFRMSPPELVEERRTICAACEHWDAGRKRCRICGCYTEAKIRMRTEHCPLPAPKW